MDRDTSGEVWLRDLYTAHWSGMVRLASLLLGSSDQAEEVVQDGLVAVHHRREQFDSMEHAAAYLRMTVVNRCRSVHRHRSVVNRYRPDPRAGVETPEAALDRGETHDEVMMALRTLPQRQREVLILRFYSQASEAEIAETLGISKGAVKSHAHRGMQALRQSLAPVMREGR
jgi:RNA polymerase sigma-70 factor (sigma-E family)